MKKLWDKFVTNYLPYWFAAIFLAIITAGGLGITIFLIRWILTMLGVV